MNKGRLRFSFSQTGEEESCKDSINRISAKDYKGFRTRLRFAFTQTRDRREEPHHSCITSICIKDHFGLNRH
ncbi:hypothetical protein VNO78_12236 [Psophocarpus tetragonolobus]|uniref:Uncharacterized protein n=1 Tax=Psophocarpus tetragonolobus TaxID=3891 RepID=A0AAN9XPN8_PSOTE